MSSGASPAEPPQIALIRDLVNTVEWQEDDEAWPTASRLAAWMRERSMPAAGVSAAHLVRGRRIREGLREVLLSHAGHEPRRAAIEDLNDALSDIPLTLVFTADGAARVRATGGRDANPLAPIVEAIHTARQHAGWQRLKACSRDTCRWAYWDSSRNGSGRWCSMEGCGNYVKMRRRNGRDSDSLVIPQAGTADRVATLVDVASRAGVSAKTVSNVVNGAGHVAEPTRARVQQAIDELGYRPNLAARQLRTGAGSASAG